MTWFRRLFPYRQFRSVTSVERSEPVGPAGPEEIAKARDYLRIRVGVDIDKFLAHRATVSIFEQPLGATKHCLSVNEVADFVERKVDLPRRSHLAICEECRRSVATYRRAAADEWDPFTQTVTIYKAHEIRLPKGADFFLILTNTAENRVLAQLDPRSVSVKGAIEAAGCRIDPLDAKDYDAREAVALRFNKYSLNLPKRKSPSTPIADWLTVSASADGVKVQKQALVCVQVG